MSNSQSYHEDKWVPSHQATPSFENFAINASDSSSAFFMSDLLLPKRFEAKKKKKEG